MTEDEKLQRINQLWDDINRVVVAHTDSMPGDPLGIGVEAMGLAFADHIVRRILRLARNRPSVEFMMDIWQGSHPEMRWSFQTVLDKIKAEH